MEQEEATCFACLTEIQEATEIVYFNTLHDEENGLTYGDCLDFCANIANFGDIVEKNTNYFVCNDCSIELEISYKFLKKLMISHNLLRQEINVAEQIFEDKRDDSEEDQQQQHTEEHNNDDNEEETQEVCVTEYSDGNDIWTAEEINNQQESHADDQAEIAKMLINDDTETESQDKTLYDDDDEEVRNDEELQVVETETQQSPPLPSNSNEDDLVEEIAPYEEIEVYTYASSDIERAPESAADNIFKIDEQQHKRRRGKFNCDYCGKLFPNYSRMTAHRRCHEKTRTTFNCVECGRMYATDQALSVHIRTAHNIEGFTCPVCSKVFLIERSLEIHMRYHTRTFPYDCKDCGKNFAQKGHLNTHQNVKHNGLRFICVHPNCNKLFTSSAALRDHEFSHNLKPFECQYCQGGYSSKSKLKTHIRQVHNLDLSLDELEPMRRFHVMSSKPNCVMDVTASD